jgi:hypothetical protein
VTAPTELAVEKINQTAQKAKPIKAIEPIVETEAEELPQIRTERKASVVEQLATGPKLAGKKSKLTNASKVTEAESIDMMNNSRPTTRNLSADA